MGRGTVWAAGGQQGRRGEGGGAWLCSSKWPSGSVLSLGLGGWCRGQWQGHGRSSRTQSSGARQHPCLTSPGLLQQGRRSSGASCRETASGEGVVDTQEPPGSTASQRGAGEGVLGRAPQKPLPPHPRAQLSATRLPCVRLLVQVVVVLAALRHCAVGRCDVLLRPTVCSELYICEYLLRVSWQMRMCVSADFWGMHLGVGPLVCRGVCVGPTGAGQADLRSGSSIGGRAWRVLPGSVWQMCPCLWWVLPLLSACEFGRLCAIPEVSAHVVSLCFG